MQHLAPITAVINNVPLQGPISYQIALNDVNIHNLIAEKLVEFLFRDRVWRRTTGQLLVVGRR